MKKISLRQAVRLGNQEGVHWKEVSLKELRMGIEEEQEHTSDLPEATKIALVHLEERKDYYTRLKRVMR